MSHELPGHDWLATGRHSFCPECGSPDVYMRLVLVKDEPQGSLAGMQVKFTMHEAWEFFCTACGANGPAGLRESVTERMARGEHVPGHDPATCRICSEGSEQ